MQTYATKNKRPIPLEVKLHCFKLWDDNELDKALLTMG
jgi:hypothetical protein